MSRQKKAPEFQCHVKFKNDLPLPAVSPVLFPPSLTLSKDHELHSFLTNEASQYAPTSLESGTNCYTLPADLLNFPCLNMVDLERFNVKKGKDVSNSLVDDKDILVPIEEIEKKQSAAAVGGSSNKPTTAVVESTIKSMKPTQNIPIKSFPRPDVTWLRRTEYISSARHSVPASSSGVLDASSSSDPLNSDDNVKALLATSVPFSSIVTAVEETFRACQNRNDVVHPTNSNLKLEQSFPLIFDYNSVNGPEYAHCLFLGEYQRQGKNSDDISILKVNDDNTQDNHNHQNNEKHEHVTLFTSTGSGNDSNEEEQGDLLKASAEFDLMDVSVSANAKGSLVLFLPINSNTNNDDHEDAAAKLVKINANYSLKKRRCRLNPLKLKIIRKN